MAKMQTKVSTEDRINLEIPQPKKASLKPFKFLTDKAAISLYLLSISFTHHLRPCAASDISVITGVSK